MIAEHGIYDIAIDSEMVEGCEFDERELVLMAEDVRRHGVVVFPMVRYSTSEVIVGHMAIAACLRLGRSVCRVRLVDGDDADIARLREKYASYSGLDSEESMLRTIKSYMEQGGRGGRQAGSKAAAIRRYAEEHDLTFEAAKKRFQRGERRLRHKRFMREDRYETCPIEDWGAETDRDYRITLYHLLDRFAHFKTCLTRASRVLEATQLDPQTKMPESRYKSLASLVEKLQRRAHESVPCALCPACAGGDEADRRKCLRCMGTGYATNATIGQYPDEMKVRR